MTTDDTTAVEQRACLARLERTDTGLVLHDQTPHARVTLPTYSRFKYGDGGVSRTYGRALADMALSDLPEMAEIMVTSSGFGFVPPAAHSLVAPFCERAKEVGGPSHARAFRVLRSTVSNGDYASMTLQERKEAMSHHALSIDSAVNLWCAHVVSLDDVRVTGVHEEAMDACLWAAGAASVRHLYIVDAWDARHDPSTEAVLNASGVKSTSELLDIATGPDFIPNARFCKRVITMPPKEMHVFLEKAPWWLAEWIEYAIGVDNLAQYDAYAPGCKHFEHHMRNRVAPVL